MVGLIIAMSGFTLGLNFLMVVLIGLIALFWVLYKGWSKYNRVFNYHPGRQQVEQNREVYTELVELRAISDADRAYVFRFHNGQEFLPSHPAWKISCTHEVVRHGVTYEAGRLQGILVSLVPNIIGPVLSGTSNGLGITIPECSECPFRTKCLKENKRVVVVQVDEMESSFCRFHLEGQNIKTTLFCGLAKGGIVYGLVGVDFCGTALPKAKVSETVQMVCRATDRIQYRLQSKKMPVDLHSDRMIPSIIPK